MKKTTFRTDLEALINKHNMESGSNTPDFILTDYIIDCLYSYDRAVTRRTKWFSIEHEK